MIKNYKESNKKAVFIILSVFLFINGFIGNVLAITIDGDNSDWADNPMQPDPWFDNSSAGDIQDFYMTNDSSKLYIGMKIGGGFDVRHIIFLDTDKNPGTGSNMNPGGIGADYRLVVNSTVTIFQTWNQSLGGWEIDVSASTNMGKAYTSHFVELSVDLADLVGLTEGLIIVAMTVDINDIDIDIVPNDGRINYNLNGELYMDGGGGFGSTGSGESMIDFIAPMKGDMHIPTNGPVTLMFGTTVDQSTVESAFNMSYANGTTISSSALTFDWKTDNFVDVFPTNNNNKWLNFTNYTFTIGSGAKNSTGGDIIVSPMMGGGSLPYSSYFTTGDQSDFGQMFDPSAGQGGNYLGNIWVSTDTLGNDACDFQGNIMASYMPFCTNNYTAFADNYYVGVGVMSPGNVTVYIDGTVLGTVTANNPGKVYSSTTNYFNESIHNVTVVHSLGETFYWNLCVGSSCDSTPTTVETSPSDGVINVQSEREIRLTFNKPMDISSVNSSTYLLNVTGSTNVTRLSYTWSDGNKTLLLTLPQGERYTPGSTYRIYARGDDVFGNVLQTNGLGYVNATFTIETAGKLNLTAPNGFDLDLFTANPGGDTLNDINQSLAKISLVNNATAVDMGPIDPFKINLCPSYNISIYQNNTVLKRGNTYCVRTNAANGYAIFYVHSTVNGTNGYSMAFWALNSTGRGFEKSQDRDYDGIDDRDDACPDQPGPTNADATKNGCPTMYMMDSDNDGIPDPDDRCPFENGPFSSGGCPVSGTNPCDPDGDGVPSASTSGACPAVDYPDMCPNQFGFPNPIPSENGCTLSGDTDTDGIPDSQDQCPNAYGPPHTGGCPLIGQEDADFDGIPDSSDQCPNEAGPPSFAGCPGSGTGFNDTDMDGVPDDMDMCPAERGAMFTGGCPSGDMWGGANDTDFDGLPDNDDNCPYESGPMFNMGCPTNAGDDADNDGIPDDMDDCDFLAGPPFNGGCPGFNDDPTFMDADMDGIPNEDDKCPQIFGPPFFAGCPGDNSSGTLVMGEGGDDSDNDGIPNNDDGCPNEFGPPFNKGCPSSAIFGEGTSDRDMDGVPDTMDGCPSSAGPPFTGGCPLSNVSGNSSMKDSDFDGLGDNEDACPFRPGPPFMGGCPPDELGAGFENFNDDDMDGVPNEKDQCPIEPGPPSMAGCPDYKAQEMFGISNFNDTDLDGIPDGDDGCPSRPGPPFMNGCPPEELGAGFENFNDNDMDGVPNDGDQCPFEPGPPSMGGCPAYKAEEMFGSGFASFNDTDMDGIPDEHDDCQYRPGPPFMGGCPPDELGAGFENFNDDDMDGVPNDGDQCPLEPGPPFMGGCPDYKAEEMFGSEFANFNDTDRDGIPDNDDGCPYRPGPPFMGGCPPSELGAGFANFNDSDMDGVPDDKDQCPKEPGPPFMGGCPDYKAEEMFGSEFASFNDSDRDGVSDEKDKCVREPGPPFMGGCPPDRLFERGNVTGTAFNDTDRDGVPDDSDQCQYEPGPPFMGGCPDYKAEEMFGSDFASFNDTDRDGVPDEKDKCMREPGPPFMGGCPPDRLFSRGNISGTVFNDTDMDGVPDGKDDCLFEPGPPFMGGCPDYKLQEMNSSTFANFNDTDRDGVPDEDDKCMREAGPPFMGGCPPDRLFSRGNITGIVFNDTDMDGVPNERDDCPFEAGPPFMAGCPGYKAEEMFGSEFANFNDTDRDGVPDEDDDCLREPGPPFMGGCPPNRVANLSNLFLNDTDRDGIPDEIDDCQFESGPPFMGGCPDYAFEERMGFTINDTDRDGTPDDMDDCVYKPGPPFTAGCPGTDKFGADFADNDNDGVPDFEDTCPNEPGPPMNGGCSLKNNDNTSVTDKDFDGITDVTDNCPSLFGPSTNGGCPMDLAAMNTSDPDYDGDGVPNSQEYVNVTLGINCTNSTGTFLNTSYIGCPVIPEGESDTDNDGVGDTYDHCPNSAGPIFNSGCPVNNQSKIIPTDKDKDGVPDQVDNCPDRSGVPFLNGCPFGKDSNNKSMTMDNDADGIKDSIDNCPGVSNPGQEDADGDNRGDSCDFRNMTFPKKGIVFEEGTNVNWSDNVLFPEENISLTFNGSVGLLKDFTVNVTSNITLPKLGNLTNFTMEYIPPPEDWVNFSGFKAKINSSGFLMNLSNDSEVGMFKGNVTVNFSYLYSPVNISKLVGTAQSNTTENITGVHTLVNHSDVTIDMNLTNATGGTLKAVFTGLNPEQGDNTSAVPMPNQAGDTPFLQIQDPDNMQGNMTNATVCMKIPPGYDNSSLKVNYFNATNGTWDEIDPVISGNNACFNTSHFSVYGLSGSLYSAPAAPSGGGGGGGGGGGANEANQFISMIEAGVTKTAEFSEKLSPYLSKIEITASKTLYSVSLTVGYPSSSPYGAEEITDKVFKYIQIKKPATVSDSDIEKAVISFSVEKEWLKSNDINKDAVSLVRLEGSTWTELETSVTDEDDGNVYFQAITPGFSYFAIKGAEDSGFEKVADVISVPTAPVVEDKPEEIFEHVPEAVQEAEEAPPVVEEIIQKQAEPQKRFGLCGPTSLALLSIVPIFFRRARRKRGE